MRINTEDNNEDPLTAMQELIRSQLALEVMKQVESNAIRYVFIIM